jgi:hypothetical protein
MVMVMTRERYIDFNGHGYDQGTLVKYWAALTWLSASWIFYQTKQLLP